MSKVTWEAPRQGRCFHPGSLASELNSLSSHLLDQVSFYRAILASLVAQRVKKLPAVQKTRFETQVGEIPWSWEWLPTPVFLPGESHRGACWATVHGVIESQTHLGD